MPKAFKVGQSPINRQIWSHCWDRLSVSLWHNRFDKLYGQRPIYFYVTKVLLQHLSFGSQRFFFQLSFIHKKIHFTELKFQFPVLCEWFLGCHSLMLAPCTDVSPRTASPGLTRALPVDKNLCSLFVCNAQSYEQNL